MYWTNFPIHPRFSVFPKHLILYVSRLIYRKQATNSMSKISKCENSQILASNPPERARYEGWVSRRRRRCKCCVQTGWERLYVYGWEGSVFVQKSSFVNLVVMYSPTREGDNMCRVQVFASPSSSPTIQRKIDSRSIPSGHDVKCERS